MYAGAILDFGSRPASNNWLSPDSSQNRVKAHGVAHRRFWPSLTSSRSLLERYAPGLLTVLRTHLQISCPHEVSIQRHPFLEISLITHPSHPEEHRPFPALWVGASLFPAAHWPRACLPSLQQVSFLRQEPASIPPVSPGSRIVLGPINVFQFKLRNACLLNALMNSILIFFLGGCTHK